MTDHHATTQDQGQSLLSALSAGHIPNNAFLDPFDRDRAYHLFAWLSVQLEDCATLKRVAWGLAAATGPSSAPTGRQSVVGVGGCGTNTVMAALSTGAIPRSALATVNFDDGAADESPIQHRIRVPMQSPEILRWASNRDGSAGRCRVCALANAALFVNALGGYEEVILVFGGAGARSAGFSTAAAALLKAREVRVRAVIAMPFTFEGRVRRRAAERCAALIKGIADTVDLHEGNELQQEPRVKQLSMLDAYRRWDEVLAERVAGMMVGSAA